MASDSHVRSRFDPDGPASEPNNYFDVLFVVELPAFNDFYNDLIADGVEIGEVEADADDKSATGDLEYVDLREGYQAYDFEVPIIIRDVDEELQRRAWTP